MKKQILFVTALGLLFSLVGCGQTYSPIDYSKEENWYCLGKGGTKEVDTIFIYPTVCMQGGVVTSIEENKKGVADFEVRQKQSSVFDKDTNLYMPLYRQCAVTSMSGNSVLDVCDLLYRNQGYKDLENALDYYFKYFNNNKPFILAGHSQGSTQLYNLLTNYMQKHPAYLTKMVATYAIGFGMTKTEIGKYPNLKFATGETDTNCIISYNTAGPQHGGRSLLHDPDSFVINPINWKTDDTLATADENLGSLVDGQIVTNVSDAKVDASKGYLVSSADSKYEGKGTDSLFGTHTFHTYDFGFYYNNLIDNVGKRINAFLEK